MKKRKIQAYILLAICVLMQVAAVFPHHHHSEMFCLHPDLAVCAEPDACPDTMHHAGDKDRHTCGMECITHFQCGTPDHHLGDVSPGYLFCTLLYPLLAAHGGLSIPETSANAGSVPYIESLHAHYLVRASGLRAPPSL